MDCPKCKMEMLINRADYIALNDDTPDTPTEMMHISICKCRNKNCTEYGKDYNGGITPLPMANTQKAFCSDCGLLLYEGAQPPDKDTLTCPNCSNA